MSAIANRLHKAAIKGDWGDWDEASKLIEEKSVAVRAGITEYKETGLIVAVKSKKRNDFVKDLSEKMSALDITLYDTRNRTALHRAAGADNREITEKLVEMNPYLPNAKILQARIPLYFAATRGCEEMCDVGSTSRKKHGGKKELHNQALELVKFLCNVLCDEIADSNNSKAKKIFELALFQATSLGIVEIVEEILKSYPDAIYLVNEDNPSIFHHATKCRHAKVFNLIHQVGESRTIFLSQSDKLKNNALHLAGKLAPQQQLNLKAGTALQMQRELQWFKVIFPDSTRDKYLLIK
ncbi:hypothetical protein HYC85_000285 [Camellia sinensis]|uniref:PGG domain-containing protein n=1 Tax=Camellia sinensis TaxID=4442 RepID=A0A7J7I3N6_CAMSI|nr:hypothetical protein HYC85_000285 [Camellia sinensis]